MLGCCHGVLGVLSWGARGVVVGCYGVVKVLSWSARVLSWGARVLSRYCHGVLGCSITISLMGNPSSTLKYSSVCFVHLSTSVLE